MTGFYVKTKDLYYYKCQKKCAGVNYSAKKLHVAFENLLNEYQLDLKVVRHSSNELAQLYKATLILIRPDQMVAWRGSDGAQAEAILKQASGA